MSDNKLRNTPSPGELKDIAAELRSSALLGLAPEAIRAIFLRLAAAYPLIGIERSHDHVWYRARICDTPEGFANVRQMLYPPKGGKSFGRASLPGSRVLYAGWNDRVALEEIGAGQGQIVQIVGLRVRAPIQFPCAVFGEYQAVFNSGRSVVYSQKLVSAIEKEIENDLNRFYANVYVDSVIAEIFRCTASCSEDYVVSAVIADTVLRKKLGLMYPSVRTSHAINIAVNADDFDANFEVIYSAVFRVVNFHGYGLYDLGLLKGTNEIAPDGQFNWKSQRTFEVEYGDARSLKVPPEFIGWRVR